MKIEWRSLASLKVSVIVAFVLIWNAGFLLAMYLGGGGLRGGLSPIGMKVTGVVCLAACLFSLSVAASKTVQAALGIQNVTKQQHQTRMQENKTLLS